MADEPTLRECPFCGKVPTVVKCDDGRYGWRGNCTACESDKTVRPEALPIALEAWNARPVEDALRARIAELEAENAAYQRRVAELSRKLIAADHAIDSLRQPVIEQRVAKLEEALREIRDSTEEWRTSHLIAVRVIGES